MSARDQYQESARFPGHRTGDTNRIDRDALPRVLLLDVSPDNRGARLHFAGDTHIRVAWVSDLAGDPETLSGMAPLDAYRIGRAAHG